MIITNNKISGKFLYNEKWVNFNFLPKSYGNIIEFFESCNIQILYVYIVYKNLFNNFITYYITFFKQL